MKKKYFVFLLVADDDTFRILGEKNSNGQRREMMMWWCMLNALFKSGGIYARLCSCSSSGSFRPRNKLSVVRGAGHSRSLCFKGCMGFNFKGYTGRMDPHLRKGIQV